ncbi:hypothetical protein RhiirA4_475440 [Rhizophagus irregularis]|uniref:Uncharacterized protein n=1 Tax=Rhizophagus irregularis TaxID=588596 RepID=A0A2I1HA62_9GLOM|nr:hypothetical protein RhiirA4_475440 [Rhizophagus irregularis]
MFTGLLERHYLDEIVDYKIVNKLTMRVYTGSTLTRNVSYFADKVPGELPATSTTITQCLIRFIIKNDFKKSLRRLKYQ